MQLTCLKFEEKKKEERQMKNKNRISKKKKSSKLCPSEQLSDVKTAGWRETIGKLRAITFKVLCLP